jgi:UDP-N-acetylmuramyl pentapeptide phosphotransferase/UDP-N-acetylglucosamine-1-phosphate transferase
MNSIIFSVQELFRYDAFLAGLASFITCVLLVTTKKWHGSLSMDTTDGLQKFHTNPTPRIGGIAIAIGVFVGYAVSSHGVAAAEKRAILSAICWLASPPLFLVCLRTSPKESQ